MPGLIRVLVLGLGAPGMSGAQTAEVAFPLRFDTALVRTLLVEQVFTGGGESLEALGDGSGCSYLVLSDPAVSGALGTLRIRSHARARIGTAVGSRCLVLHEWRGTLETDQQPVIGPGGGRIEFRTVDSRLLDERGDPATVVGGVWDLVKQRVHPRLDILTLDLDAALGGLRSALPLVLPGGDAERTRRVLDSLTLSRVAVEESALVATVRLEVPALPAAATPALPVRPLEPHELAAWQAAWQRWDAFLTYVVKAAARDGAREALRLDLAEVLLSARYDITDVLAREPTGPDPVPALFSRTWRRLAPVLRRVHLGLPGETALRYLGFITAADALESIEALRPAGVDFSAEGLRRLARIIAPAEPTDPLTRDEAVDPELRRLMGFGPPIAPPPSGGGGALLDRLIPVAYGAARLDPALVGKLNRWVPTARDVERYLPLADELLDQTADLTVARQQIPKAYHRMFHHLLRATAWKESCWRQYVHDKGKVKVLTSAIGALGMMQVDPHTWRGFYEPHALAWDIGYNARAGADILAHYLTHYALRRGEARRGIPDALARATYAAYSGGPSQLTRYRERGTAPALRRIDATFHEMYRTIKAGRIEAIGNCYGA